MREERNGIPWNGIAWQSNSARRTFVSDKLIRHRYSMEYCLLLLLEAASTPSEEWSRTWTGFPLVLAMGQCIRMLSCLIGGPVVCNEF